MMRRAGIGPGYALLLCALSAGCLPNKPAASARVLDDAVGSDDATAADLSGDANPDALAAADLGEASDAELSADSEAVDPDWEASLVDSDLDPDAAALVDDDAESSGMALAGTPTRVDFRDNGWVTAVKNQGSYPTCTTFAVAAALESAALIRLNRSIDLSEANLWYLQGRQPATLERTFTDVMNQKITTEAVWPYSMLDTMPAGPIKGVASITSLSASLDSISGIKQALAAGMPVAMAIRTSDTFMSPMTVGLIRTKNMRPNAGQHAYHAFEVVGYKDLPHDAGYLIIKNSWGTLWGVNGFGYLPYRYCSVPGFQDCHARAVPP